MATIKKLQTLFSKLKITPKERKERINAWTAGRTASAKDLQPDELQELCESLENKINFQKQQQAEDKRYIISAILTIATRTGIKQKDNWDTFNHFMLHKSTIKKSLHLCSLEELEKVLLQFRAIERKNNKSAQKPGTKAYFQSLGLPKIAKN